MTSPCRIGCAGWSIRREQAELFPGETAHLARYAGRLCAVEINSSFYRPHRRSTYARWASSVPEEFRFAVKAPREITHERRLLDAIGALEDFLGQVSGLGDKLGPILLQLPPSMEWDPGTAESFLAALRERYRGPVVLEPRHAQWFDDEAERVLRAHEVARAAADPNVVAAAAKPGGWPGLAYYRLHGSPHMYESAYGRARLEALASELSSLQRGGVPTWCVFDNTKYGASAIDALELHRMRNPDARPGRA